MKKNDQDIDFYSIGLVCMSCCAPKSMTRKQIVELANTEHPTGISSQWEISKDKFFRSGQPMPCVCEHDTTRKHWLLNC